MKRGGCKTDRIRLFVPMINATTLHEMYNHVLQNNKDITQAQAMDIAQSLTQKIRAANNAAISGNVKGMDYITTADGTAIIDLGRIYDGKLTD